MKNPVVVSMEVNITEFGISLSELLRAIKDKEAEFFAASSKFKPSTGTIRQKVYIQDSTLIVKMVYGGD